MIIEHIIVNGKRVVITSNGAEYNIHIDTYLSMSFDVGQDVDIELILFDSNKRDALSKGVSYCSRKMLTTRELMNKLAKLEYSDEVIDYCISKLKEYNYLDDYKYAELFAQSKSGAKGSMYIYHKLREKGISNKIIGELEIEEDLEAMLTILIKKYGEKKEITYTEKGKMIKFLCNRGFLTKNAIKAVDLYKKKAF